MSYSVAAARVHVVAWQRGAVWGLQGGRAVASAHHSLSNRTTTREYVGPAVTARYHSGNGWSHGGHSKVGTAMAASLPGGGGQVARQSVAGPAVVGGGDDQEEGGEEGLATPSTLYKDSSSRNVERGAFSTAAAVDMPGPHGMLALYTGGPISSSPRMLPLSRRMLRTDGRWSPSPNPSSGAGSSKRQAGSLSVNREDAAAVSWVEQAPLELAGYLSVYKELSKIKLGGLVVLTTMVGYAMAPGEFSGTELFLTTLGTSFCVASANTLNQVRGGAQHCCG